MRTSSSPRSTPGSPVRNGFAAQFADTARRIGRVASQLVQAQGWVVYTIGADGNAGRVLWAEEDARRCAAYFSGHHRDDPLAPHRIAGAPHAIGWLRQRLDGATVRYEQDFMHPYQLSDALDMLLPAGPDGPRLGVSLLRDAPHPGFSNEQMDALADFHALAAQLLAGADPRARLAARCPQLTPRELDIALAVAAGMPNKQVAREAGMAPSTVKTHLAHVFRKCGIASRGELARLAY
jgi:DNA-binding CsgD family transcriptional regulator